MKQKKLKTLFVILGFVLIGLVIQKYILGGSLVWKTYKNPSVSFTFRYPSNWYLCEELYPNLKENFIHVSDEPIGCENITYTSNSRYLSISNSSRTTTHTDIKSFLEEMEKEDIEYKKSGGFPRIPGFTWQFQSYRKNLLILPGSSVAKVSGIGGILEYVALYDGNVYGIRPSEIDTLRSLPFRIILWTVRTSN